MQDKSDSEDSANYRDILENACVNFYQKMVRKLSEEITEEEVTLERFNYEEFVSESLGVFEFFYFPKKGIWSSCMSL